MSKKWLIITDVLLSYFGICFLLTKDNAQCYLKPVTFIAYFILIVLISSQIIRFIIICLPYHYKYFFFIGTTLANLPTTLLGIFSLYALYSLMFKEATGCFSPFTLEIFNYCLVMVIGLYHAALLILATIIGIIFCPCIVLFNYRMWKGTNKPKYTYYCSECQIEIKDRERCFRHINTIHVKYHS